MPEQPKDFSQPVAAVYKDAVDNIRFGKQQQWSVTNYAALSYGVLGYLGTKQPLFDHCIAKTILTIAATGVLLFSVYLLWDLQDKIGNKFRKRVTWVYDNCFTCEQREALALEKRSFWSDAIFVGLVAVSLAGAAIVIVLVWVS